MLRRARPPPPTRTAKTRPRDTNSKAPHSPRQHTTPQAQAGAQQQASSSRLIRFPCSPSCHHRRRTLACRALLQPSPSPPRVAQDERALQCLLESGIRGSLAALLALPLHVDLAAAWAPDAGAVALGLRAALPLVLLDAALLLPDGRAIAAAAAAASSREHGRGSRDNDGSGDSGITGGASARFAWLLGTCLTAARETAATYSLASPSSGPLLQRVALAGAAQLSEELMLRCAMLGFAGMWLGERLAEAGLADATLGGAGGPPLHDALLWGVAAASVLATGRRYGDHAAGRVAALEAQRRADAAAALDAGRLLRYRPQSEQQEAAAEAARRQRETGESGRHASRLAAAAERAAAALLGGRAVLGSAAAFAAFFASGGNPLASFSAGLALRLATAALCDAAARDEAAPGRRL